MRDVARAAFDPAECRNYATAIAQAAQTSPDLGARAIVDYVESFCDYYGRKDVTNVFELAVLNIGSTVLKRDQFPMFKILSQDECRAHPGLCEAITKAREAFGIYPVPAPNRF